MAKYERKLLDAPCVFCGYNGPGYWQAGTHKPECPWHGVGGYDERAVMLRPVIDLLVSNLSLNDRIWIAREVERLSVAYDI